MGMQNYYRITTKISLDARKLNRTTVITNRLKGISRKGRKLTLTERVRYGKSEMLRYLSGEPIYPIGYVQHKIPMCKSDSTHKEMVDEIHLELMNQSLCGRSIEYVDNRIPLYMSQKGKCAVMGQKFESTEEIHCHHKIPKSKGGTDDYQNLILVTATVHKLIHATRAKTIQHYLQTCKPDIQKLNVLRKKVGNTILSVD